MTNPLAPSANDANYMKASLERESIIRQIQSMVSYLVKLASNGADGSIPILGRENAPRVCNLILSLATASQEIAQQEVWADALGIESNEIDAVCDRFKGLGGKPAEIAELIECIEARHPQAFDHLTGTVIVIEQRYSLLLLLADLLGHRADIEASEEPAERGARLDILIASVRRERRKAHGLE